MLAAATTRDGWDWLTFVLTLVTAVTAIAAFAAWLLDRRRRPELRMMWAVDEQDWAPHDAPTVTPGQTVRVRVALRNVGDAYLNAALANFVAPRTLALRRAFKPDDEALTSTNPHAGLEADHDRVTFFHRECSIGPGDFWIDDYLLAVPKELSEDAEVRLLFSVSHPRFNATGRRWFPSFVAPYLRTAELARKADAPWPGDREDRRRPTFIRPDPKDRLRCSPGERTDVRNPIIRVPSTGT